MNRSWNFITVAHCPTMPPMTIYHGATSTWSPKPDTWRPSSRHSPAPKPNPRTGPGRTPRADSPARRHDGPAATTAETTRPRPTPPATPGACYPDTDVTHSEHSPAPTGSNILPAE